MARRGSTVDWAIDGIRLVTITNATFTASNVFVGYWDAFASLSDNTNLSFGLVDNVRVEVPATAPTIAAQPQNQNVLQGANYILQWTSDWLGWPNLCTLCSTNDCFCVIDPCATNADQRFYRLRLSE